MIFTIMNRAWDLFRLARKRNPFMSTLIPLYYQIKHTIKNWILTKEYGAGAKIPSENELAELFKVNRLTVRQAISQLIQEGFLVPKRGKGTFVADNEKLFGSYDLEFTGFMDDLFYQISKTKTLNVQMETIQAPALISEKLQLGSKTREVVRIKRVRLMQESPFAYTVNYLPEEIGTRVSEKELFHKPLLQILEQDLGIPFTEAFQTIEASFADQELGSNLKILPGSPVLYVERTMYTSKKKPVELVQTTYRGDIYKYTVRLKTVKRNKKKLLDTRRELGKIPAQRIRLSTPLLQWISLKSLSYAAIHA